MKTLTLRQFVVEYAGVAAPYPQLEAFETAMLEGWAVMADRDGVMPKEYDTSVFPFVWAEVFKRWRVLVGR